MQVKAINVNNLHFTFFPHIEELSQQLLCTSQKEKIFYFVSHLTEVYKINEFDFEISTVDMQSKTSIKAKTVQLLPFDNQGHLLSPYHLIEF